MSCAIRYLRFDNIIKRIISSRASWSSNQASETKVRNVFNILHLCRNTCRPRNLFESCGVVVSLVGFLAWFAFMTPSCVKPRATKCIFRFHQSIHWKEQVCELFRVEEHECCCCLSISTSFPLNWVVLMGLHWIINLEPPHHKQEHWNERGWLPGTHIHFLLLLSIQNSILSDKVSNNLIW